ncbi:MAG: hypothetical protein ACTSV6_05530 [Candidatus Heimdallarchaeota archaeon]
MKKYKSHRELKMSPSAESLTIKAIFALIFVGIPLLVFSSTISDNINNFLKFFGVPDAGVSAGEVSITALLIIFGSMATIIGLVITYKTPLGNWLRKLL